MYNNQRVISSWCSKGDKWKDHMRNRLNPSRLFTSHKQQRKHTFLIDPSVYTVFAISMESQNRNEIARAEHSFHCLRETSLPRMPEVITQYTMVYSEDYIYIYNLILTFLNRIIKDRTRVIFLLFLEINYSPMSNPHLWNCEIRIKHSKQTILLLIRKLSYDVSFQSSSHFILALSSASPDTQTSKPKSTKPTARHAALTLGEYAWNEEQRETTAQRTLESKRERDLKIGLPLHRGKTGKRAG